MAGFQRESWLEQVETDASEWTILWDLKGKKNGCPAFRRSDPTMQAWMKPRRDEPWVARREKIAADLAHVLGLPHASVLVSMVPDPQHDVRPAAFVRYSLARFHLKWSRLQQRGPEAVVRAVHHWCDQHRHLLAGTWVFDTWLRNCDRSARNVMVGYEGDRLVSVYLYDSDLSQNWKGDLSGGKWQQIEVVATPRVVRERVGWDDLAPWFQRINQLDDGALHDLVHRLPSAYATPSEKVLHEKALLYRRQSLEEVFAQHLGGE